MRSEHVGDQVPDQLNARVEDLTREVHALREEISEQNELLKRTRGEAVVAKRVATVNRSWIKALVAGLLATILLGAAVSSGVYYFIDRNNQKWCGTLTILTDPDAPPPSTPRGKAQIVELEGLRDKFHCNREDA